MLASECCGSPTRSRTTDIPREGSSTCVRETGGRAGSTRRVSVLQRGALFTVRVGLCLARPGSERLRHARHRRSAGVAARPHKSATPVTRRTPRLIHRRGRSLNGDVLRNERLHRSVCVKGDFAALAATLDRDSFVYEDRGVVSVSTERWSIRPAGIRRPSSVNCHSRPFRRSSRS